MRAAILAALLVVAFAPVAGACITYIPTGYEFFTGAKAIFFGHSDGQWFHADKVLRGEVAGGKVPAPQPGECRPPTIGKRYLAAQHCGDDYCQLNWVEQNQEAYLLRYLAAAHRETHESVMRRAIRWQRGRLSDKAFEEWLRMVAPERSGQDDVKMLGELLHALLWLTGDFRLLARCDRALVARVKADELRPVAELMRAFPAGSAEDFDQLVDESRNDEATYFSDSEEALMKAIDDAWSERLDTAFHKCLATHPPPPF